MYKVYTYSIDYDCTKYSMLLFGVFFSLEFIWFFVKIKTLPSLDIIQVCCPKPNESVFFLKFIFKSIYLWQPRRDNTGLKVSQKSFRDRTSLQQYRKDLSL